MYDAIQMDVPVFAAKDIRFVPYYLRYRVRLVKEVLKEVSFERARRAKVTLIFDLSNF